MAKRDVLIHAVSDLPQWSNSQHARVQPGALLLPTSVPSPSVQAGEVVHGSQITPNNTGLRGAGYTYDSGTDTFTHPTYGPLTPSGSITVTQDNQVIEGLDITGSVKFGSFSGVILRRCRVRYSGTTYAVQLNAAPSNAGHVIEDCDLEGTTNGFDAFGVYGRQVTVSRCNIFHFQVGVYFQGDNSHVVNCCIWDPQYVDGTHGTGSSENGGANNVSWTRCYIMGCTSSAIGLYADNQPHTNLTIQDSYFTNQIPPWGGQVGRGSYLINMGGKAFAASNQNVHVLNNVMYRGPDHPLGGDFGSFQNFGTFTGTTGAKFCNNRWSDDDSLISADFGGC